MILDGLAPVVVRMSAGPDDITGCGNYNLLVWSSDGSRPVCNLWFLDSGTYGEKGVSKYARVEQDQIDWYTSTAAALEEQYGEMLPAYLFQHIIVPEIYDLLTEVPASEKKAEGVVKGFSSRSTALPPVISARRPVRRTFPPGSLPQCAIRAMW